MKITAISKRRKSLVALELFPPVNPTEYNAETDSLGLITIDSFVCEQLCLKSGMEISEDQLRDIIEKSFLKRAKNRAMWYLEQGDMSKKQLFLKLARSFPKQSAEKAVDRMEELGLLDDERYAARQAEKLIFEKRNSPEYAAYLLTTKGIDRSLARRITDEIEVDNSEIIREIIERRYHGDLSDEKQLNRAVGYLSRRGFSFSDIKKVTEEYKKDSEEYY